jgi:hypothetical protein
MDSYISLSGNGQLLLPSACDELDSQRGRSTQRGLLYGNSWIKLSAVTDGTTLTLTVGERGLPKNGEYGWITGPGLADACPNGWTDVVLPSDDSIGLGGLRQRTDDDGEAFHWWSLHTGGSHFLFVDSSLRFLSYSIDPVLFRSFSTRAVNDHILEPDF